MTSDLTPVPPPDPSAAIARVRAELRDARAALDGVTGGAPPRAVLAELAHGLAAELASHFDELPMHRFVGRVARGGALGALLPRRGVPHRVVLARYLAATVGRPARPGYVTFTTRIGLLALGADGVLRTGSLWEQVVLGDDANPFEGPLAWDDARVRRVPSRPVALARWTGGVEASDVASPPLVIDALTAIAASVAGDARRDLALLQRLIDSPR